MYPDHVEHVTPFVTRHPYRGVNVFVLSMTARAAGYGSPYWLTFNQARSMGGTVKRGEHGTPVVFWKWFDAPAADDRHTTATFAPAPVTLTADWPAVA
jgi:antirestriction protein ArdC